METTIVAKELEQVINAVVRSISLDTLDLTDEFFPAHLPVALIDAVFRTRYRYGGLSIPVAERYCRHYGIARTRVDRWNTPPPDDQATLGDLIRNYDEIGLGAMTTHAFGMRRGILELKATKPVTVLRAARALRSIGVDVLQDMSARHSNEIYDALQVLPKVGRDTVRRLLMYTGGDDFVLGDAYVRRFVAKAVGRKTVSSGEAEALVRSAAHELILSPRFLDCEIWLYGHSR